MWNRIYANLISITDIVPVKTVSHVSKFRTIIQLKKHIPAAAKLGQELQSFRLVKMFMSLKLKLKI